MPLSPNEQTIKALYESSEDLQALGQDYPAIAADINARPLISNPVPRGTVPKPLAWPELLALVPIAEKANFLDLGTFQGWAKGIIQNEETPAEVLTALDAVLTAMAGQTGQDVLGSAKYLADIGDRPNLKNLAMVCVFQGLMNIETAGAIQSEVDATIDDPNYQSQVFGLSLAEENDLGKVTEFDVQNALNA
jgi:hypothetical protein